MWLLISLKQIPQEALSRELLAKVPLNQFLKKNTKLHFEQKINTQKYQNHFQKLIKHSKIFLGLIDKKLSIHIIFEHVQSHKWDKHYLNKVLCVVCEYQMWNSP